jgi:hypothetical protein
MASTLRGPLATPEPAPCFDRTMDTLTRAEWRCVRSDAKHDDECVEWLQLPIRYLPWRVWYRTLAVHWLNECAHCRRERAMPATTILHFLQLAKLNLDASRMTNLREALDYMRIGRVHRAAR